MKFLTGSIGALLLAASAPAQAQQGDFVVTAPANPFAKTNGGLFVVGGIGGTVTDLRASGDLRNSYAVATDPYQDSDIWVGTRSPSKTVAPAIYRIVTVAGKILTTKKLFVALAATDQTIYQLRVWGHRLLFLTATQLSSVPLTGGKPTVILRFSSTTGIATNFAGDGRNLYIHMQPNRTLLAEHIVHLDLEVPQIRTTIYRAAGITYFIPSLTLDPAGNLLITESEAFSGASSLKLLDPAGKNLRTFKLPFTHGVVGAHMDSTGSVIVVAGKTYDATNKRTVTGFITLLLWKLFKTQFGTSPELYTRLDVRGQQSLNRYGHVCASARKWRPNIAAIGLPRIGNAGYKLWVKGIPRANAMLLIGVHGAMPVPFSLSVMGASTCELGLQPLIAVPVTLTSNGDRTLSTPIPAAARAGNIDIQWLVAEKAANPAGFVSSQVGSIVIR